MASEPPPLYLHGLGHSYPENVITNAFLEELDIGSSSSWIEERVGIETRRTVLPLDYIRETRNRVPHEAMDAALHSNAETGAEASRIALSRAGLNASDVGLIWAGGCAPDHSTPAEACAIAAELECDARAFDVSSACSTFGTQMHFLSMMRPECLPDFVLLVCPENTTRFVDYGDRGTASLWGDGSAAAIVSMRYPSPLTIRTHTLASKISGWDKVRILRGGHFTQEGKTVQTFAIKRTEACIAEIRAHAAARGKEPSDLYFIGHQANGLMLESVCRRSEITEDRHWTNVREFGNTGAAGAPGVLSQNWDRLVPGSVLAMVTVGAGLSWSSLSIDVGDGAGESPR